LRIAQAVHEKLLVLTPSFADQSRLARLPAQGAVRVDQRSFDSDEIGLAELGAMLATAGERLVVLNRGLDATFPSQLASERGVPVLVTGRGKSLADRVDPSAPAGSAR
jgi:hypothetical protein